jgi:hypothetical protein
MINTQSVARMRLQESSRRNRISLLAKAVAAAGLTLALLAPASAQFWGGWGDRGGWGRPQRPQQQQQQQFNPFGGWLDNSPREIRPPREAPADYSRAPAPQRKPDSAATTPVVVLGDSMADWLAYGLEEAFSEKPEIAIVRKNRAAAGLIRYDTRRETEWPQVVREAIAADKPKFIVMMIGVNDRQAIRERVATTPPAATTRPGAARNATPSVATPTPAPASDPELQARESAEQQNAEMQSNAEPPANAPEAGRNTGSASNFEFHTEKWEAAYIKRIDATLAALKSANVPVFWVGLPAQRSNRAASDSAYLNELYRGRAEKAGVTYVDVWDGFVDDVGRFVVQGPDFEGQIRRLRAGDGIYFTKAGARKLAHYVEREILRSMSNRAMPVALPAPEPAPVAPGARPPSGPAPRPLAGPVVPLTASTGGGDELLGGGPTRAAPSPQRPAPVDPAASRVLTRGEPLAAPSGRADDFGWPRGNPARPAAAAASPAAPTQATGSRPAAVSPPAAAAVEPPPVAAQPITAAAPAEPAAEPPVAETKPAVKRKPPAPRPVVRRDVRPEPFSPFASSPGLWR